MYVLTLIIVVALATWHVVELWHHGSLFATLRARLEVGGTFAADLLLCPFCLTTWVAWGMMIWVIGVEALLSDRPPAVRMAWYAGVLGFAAARVANLLNDVLSPYSRTPGRSYGMHVAPRANTEYGPDESGADEPTV